MWPSDRERVQNPRVDSPRGGVSGRVSELEGVGVGGNVGHGDWGASLDSVPEVDGRGAIGILALILDGGFWVGLGTLPINQAQVLEGFEGGFFHPRIVGSGQRLIDGAAGD